MSDGAKRVLVTGAGGNVGREVVRALAAAGLPFRAADRSGGPPGAEGGERVPLDFLDRASWDAALEGCDALFLLRPPAIADVKESLNPFVDRARELGVDHVIFLSVMGAGENRFVPHHAVEQHLASRSDRYTILRPGFFAQNLQDAYRRDIVEDGRLYVPAGDGRVAFVDVADAADVAATVFADPGPHRGEAYTLTGPEAVTFHDAARMLTEVLGYPVRYEAASILGYAAHVRRRGLPWGQVAVQTILHALLRRGSAERVDPTAERLLGRPPRALRAYVEAHASVWSRSGA